MYLPKNLIICFLALLCVSILNAQEPVGELRGYVYDETGFPLPGASVLLDGTEKGASADTDGLFVIDNIVPGSYNVTASYLGYGSKTEFNVIIKSVGNQPITFKLKVSENSLARLS